LSRVVGGSLRIRQRKSGQNPTTNPFVIRRVWVDPQGVTKANQRVPRLTTRSPHYGRHVLPQPSLKVPRLPPSRVQVSRVQVLTKPSRMIRPRRVRSQHEPLRIVNPPLRKQSAWISQPLHVVLLCLSAHAYLCLVTDGPKGLR
jgi:hypothetical protein